MGGTLTAIADGYESIQSNPAGLANIDTWSLRLPELLAFEFSPKVFKIVKKVQGTSSANLSQSLTEFDGDSGSIGLDALGLGWFRKRMGVMINPLSFNASMRLRSPSLLFTKINLRATADSGLSLGYAQPFLANHLRVGATFRPFLFRAGLDREITAETLSSIFGGGTLSAINELKNEGGAGWGMDGDLGVQGNLDPIHVLGYGVTLKAGLVFKNILATDFPNRMFTEQSQGDPPSLERKGSLGVAATVEDLGTVRPTLSFEYQQIGIHTDDMIEHFAVGAEALFKPLSWFQSALRLHYKAANFGGGLMVKVWKGELELGSYAVNLGKGAGVGVDRRLYLQASAEW
jgi:hypothetical protein